MTRDVKIRFGTGTRATELEFRLDDVGMDQEQARRWLDQQFAELGCEPIRPSGKVLIADKILAIARELGEQRLREDADLARTFAAVSAAALDRDVIRMDVDTLTLGY